MITLIKNLNKSSLAVELPAFVSAMVMAELLFKFHSFTFECLAFLATWAALSHVFDSVRNAAQTVK